MARSSMWLVAIAALSSLCAIAPARAQWVFDCDGEDTGATTPSPLRVYTSPSTGNRALSEYSEARCAPRAIGLLREGSGSEVLPLVEAADDHFLRFGSPRSERAKDRSLMLLTQSIDEALTYELSFRFRIPPVTPSEFSPEGAWFVMVQSRQNTSVSDSPPISLNLLRRGASLLLLLVGRNGVDPYEEFAVVNLTDDPMRYFGSWVRVHLTFRAGDDGLAHLWVSEGAGGALEYVGGGEQALRYGSEDSEHSVSMGLYRGLPLGGDGEPLPGASFPDFHVDLDDVRLYVDDRPSGPRFDPGIPAACSSLMLPEPPEVPSVEPIPDAGIADASTSDADTRDTGGRDASTSDAGVPEAGDADMDAPDVGAFDGAAPATDAEPADEGGCACSAASTRGVPIFPSLIAVLGLGWWVRRRAAHLARTPR